METKEKTRRSKTLRFTNNLIEKILGKYKFMF